jgi:hypothetical protein
MAYKYLKRAFDFYFFLPLSGIGGSHHGCAAEDIDHFLEYGYIRIDGAFTREAAAQWTSELWSRLGMDPRDKSTWPADRDRIHMPDTKRIKVAEFAPKVKP